MRWIMAPNDPEAVQALADELGVSRILAQVLINRGLTEPEAAERFLDPDAEPLPSPVEEFPDLALSLELLAEAIAAGDAIAICGDYDADGMTSTALLLRALRGLGATVDYAIPSRMTDGYGINVRLVEAFHAQGVKLILTVDNGIAAVTPIARARELGMTVIITDHHDVPPQVPPADAILNPKLIDPASPYRSLAGVGVAYVLAVSLARHLGKAALWKVFLELFTLGTIADLAPLTGVNRRWVRRGLELLPHSQIEGVRALQQVAGFTVADDARHGDRPHLQPPQTLTQLPTPPPALDQDPRQDPHPDSHQELHLPKSAQGLKPEAIGFRLGPRINAVGRIDDPQKVIELLTTDDPGVALERAMQCEAINQKRQQLCREIEAEAIALFEASEIDLARDRVLVLVREGWHHGVIGIVASRLVERYGAPVFIGTYEDEPVATGDGAPPSDRVIRGSARGIPEFDVFAALEYCKDLTHKHGGHRAAGGFSLPAVRLAAFRDRLSEFACQCLESHHLKPLVQVDVQAAFTDLEFVLYDELEALQPCGIGNERPVLWTPGVRVLQQGTVGQEKAHLKLTLAAGDRHIKAIGWGWSESCPVPNVIDVAYRLKENEWQGHITLELELAGMRASSVPGSGRSLRLAEAPASLVPTRSAAPTLPLPPLDPSAHPPRSQPSAQPALPNSPPPAPQITAPQITASPSTAPSSTAPSSTAPSSTAPSSTAPSSTALSPTAAIATLPRSRATFRHAHRTYTCSYNPAGDPPELRIRNQDGKVLALAAHSSTGLLGESRDRAQPVDLGKPFFQDLIRAAIAALQQAPTS
jgi:single-stranded-DNA-specific exonuclease